MFFPFGETVTLIHRTVVDKDALGNDVVAPDSETVSNVPVWPVTETEQLNAQDLSIVELRMLLPDGYDAGLIDAVTVYGEAYEVDGIAERFQNPFIGLNPGTLVHLRRSTG
jgi:hypothetical protein